MRLNTALQDDRDGQGGPVALGEGRAYGSRYTPLLAGSAAMRRIRAMVDEVADTDATVLILGESGVGKDVVARTLHEVSSRHAGPFVKVNCAALPGDLLESELFGHEKGAFTGAYRRKLGRFELANRGTILLDEIGELPPVLQAKLLHVLQDLHFSRIGGRELIRADVRVVASTNRDLEQAMRSGAFREDLYYRLNVIELRIPPLRDRREEIPALAASFLARYNGEYRRDVPLTAKAVGLFSVYPWPGNVRELENLVRRGVVLGSMDHACQQLTERLQARAGSAPGNDRDRPHRPAATEAPAVLGLKEVARRAAAEAEQKVILEVLGRVRWNRSEAARLLKVSYKTLLNKIAERGLTAAGAPADSLAAARIRETQSSEP